MKKIFLIGILILLCVAAISGFPHTKHVNTKHVNTKHVDTKISGEKIAPNPEAELRLAMRALWESRAILLRNYIVSAMNDSKDAGDAIDKLLNNAGDLGASIRPYYGYLAGGILTVFLKEDVSLTAEVIKAARIGNKKGLDRATKKWYANALHLAGFFAITHNQTMEYLTGRLYKHLDLTWGEIQSIIEKDEAKDLDYYEKDRTHMLMFSDVLTDGIVKQFPDKFKE